MDDKKRVEGVIKKVNKDDLVIELDGKEINFPVDSSDCKEGDKVYLRLFTEEDEAKEKGDIAREILNEVLNGEKEK